MKKKYEKKKKDKWGTASLETYFTIPANVEHVCKLWSSNFMPSSYPAGGGRGWGDVGVCLCKGGGMVCGCLYSLKDMYRKVYSRIIGNDHKWLN